MAPAEPGDAPPVCNAREPIVQLKEFAMFGIIAAILIILWLGGFAFHIAGGLIHLLLILALIAAVAHFLTGRRTV
jgi:hypothetical protein